MTAGRRQFFSADCPACGASGQKIAWWKALNRRAAVRCNRCDRRLESEIRFREYLGVCAVSSLMAFLTGWVVIVALLSDRWILAIVGALLTLGPAFLVNMAFHAQCLRAVQTNERSGTA